MRRLASRLRKLRACLFSCRSSWKHFSVLHFRRELTLGFQVYPQLRSPLARQFRCRAESLLPKRVRMAQRSGRLAGRPLWFLSTFPDSALPENECRSEISPQSRPQHCGTGEILVSPVELRGSAILQCFEGLLG